MVELVQEQPELAARDGVDAGRRLVEEEERRPRQQRRARAPASASCRPREPPPAARRSGQPDAREQLGRALPRLGVGDGVEPGPEQSGSRRSSGPRRARSAAARSRRRPRSSRTTVPDVGASRPATRRKNVVLPAPSGPIRANISPRPIARSIAAARRRRRSCLVSERVATITARRTRRRRHLGRLAGHERRLQPAVEVDLRRVDEVHPLGRRVSTGFGVNSASGEISVTRAGNVFPGKASTRTSAVCPWRTRPSLRLGDEGPDVEAVREGHRQGGLPRPAGAARARPSGGGRRRRPAPGSRPPARRSRTAAAPLCARSTSNRACSVCHFRKPSRASVRRSSLVLSAAAARSRSVRARSRSRCGSDLLGHQRLLPLELALREVERGALVGDVGLGRRDLGRRLPPAKSW